MSGKDAIIRQSTPLSRSGKISLDSLLRWSVENATRGEDNTAATDMSQYSGPIDTAVIDAILGKPDAQLMKEAMQIACDASLDVERRAAALEDLVDLVEGIDNACDLEPTGLWKPLLTFLHRDVEPSLRDAACWVISTSVSNNPKAASAFVKFGGIQRLQALLGEKGQWGSARMSSVVSGLIGAIPEVARLLENEIRGALRALADTTTPGDSLWRSKPILARRLIHLARVLFMRKGEIGADFVIDHGLSNSLLGGLLAAVNHSLDDPIPGLADMVDVMLQLLIETAPDSGHCVRDESHRVHFDALVKEHAYTDEAKEAYFAMPQV